MFTLWIDTSDPKDHSSGREDDQTVEVDASTCWIILDWDRIAWVLEIGEVELDRVVAWAVDVDPGGAHGGG